MDPEIEEIRRLQLERNKTDGKLASFSEISYDTELYGHSSKPEGDFDDSIALDVEDEEEAGSYQTSKQKFLNSFSAPKQYFQETFDSKEADEDVFKDFKRKTIAEKENEYQAKWRKRAKVSPPRLDPYLGKKEDAATHNSFRDLMIDVNLEKERADVLRKIEQKQREEREQKSKEERRQERLKQEEIKKQKKQKKQTKERSSSRSPVSESPKKKQPKLSSWEREGEEEGEKWSIEIMKNDIIVETLILEPDISYNLGRGDSEIKLEHGSCSKNHAKISFNSGRPNIMDLNSTNGTFLNGEELVPAQWYKLSDGDNLKFACSTREYHVKCK